MHILVPVQRVVDHNVKVRVKSDGSGIETAHVKMSINPFDEVAVEQAVRMREHGAATKVTAVACGPAASQDVLRTALALGADAAVLVLTEAPPEPLEEAELLKAIVLREEAALVLCGQQSTDDDLGATGPMLAALLDWPQAVSVNRLARVDAALEVGCDADAGTESWSLPWPAVVCVDLRLCEPRHITLPAMMRARKAALTTLAATALAPKASPRVAIVGVREPSARLPGARLAGVAELVERLRAMPALTPA